MSQEEYYQLQAILFPVYNPDRWSKPNDRTVNIGTRAEIAAWNSQNAMIDRQIQAIENGFKSYTESLREQIIRERLKAEDEATRDAVVAVSRVAKAKRSAEQKKLIDRHSKAIDINDVELTKRFPDWQELQTRIKQTVATREKERPSPLQKLAVYVETDPNPAVHHLLRRGQHNQPDEPVKPGVLTALSTPKNEFKLPPRASELVSTGRRTAFANWLTSPDNPLLARVYVNRIWQQHFGTGIVATPDNLGISGARPSHPELLDYLAYEFQQKGWSTRAIHRLILNSSVYRQTSDPRPAFHDADPDNRMLATFPVRRLDSEAVRDAMLCASGELDATMEGAYVPSQRTSEGVVEVPENKPGSHRRSVYLQQRRTQVVTFLQIFDSPTIVTTCGKRTPSTVPLQSLALLNSEFVRKRGEALASRVAKEAGTDRQARLDRVFRLTCGRSPFHQERIRSEKFLVDQMAVYAKEKDPESRAWSDLAQMLLSSHAFLYVE